jgi:hypothetical protein
VKHEETINEIAVDETMDDGWTWMKLLPIHEKVGILTTWTRTGSEA